MTGAPPVVRGVVAGPALVDLRRWTAEAQAWPVGSHRFGQYAERTARGDTVCRTENVSACHPGFDGLVSGPLAALASDVLGEEAAAFKDKLNYKQPGGAGFSPHQDAPAYPGAATVLSVLVAVDACTTESGCLWLADGVDAELPVDERGVVTAETAGALEWYPAELDPGDAVLLAGYTPHHSEANRSGSPRRVLVASYAPSGEGYHRGGYYAARAERMAARTAADRRFRISTLADFEGTEVEGPPVASGGGCTHP